MHISPTTHIDSLLAIATTTTTIIVAEISDAVTVQDSTEFAKEMHIFLVPLIGGMFFCCGAILLNPDPEKRRQVVGRLCIALPTCAALPSLIAMIHPAIKDVFIHPVVLFLAGGVIALLAYIFAKAFVAKLYARQDDGADEIISGINKIAPVIPPAEKLKP